jgi:hypothetical protein
MAAKTIMLKGHGVRNERVANAAITPGHFVELMSTNKVKVHATAGGAVLPKAVAVEDDLQGKTIADAYSSGAPCQFNVVGPGDEVFAILANGENAAIGDKLISAGDGTLKELTSQTTDESVVAIALEALDMSDSSAADPASARIKVMIV